MGLYTIYIRMLEGVETFIPVQAECININNSLFHIIENEDMDLDEDATCIYEFFPGDIVKCTRRNAGYVSINLQDKQENFWLACQLVSSTFPNRKLYHLIFLIVSSAGRITVEKLQGFGKEVDRLCTDSNIKQRNHPIVKKWLSNNMA